MTTTCENAHGTTTRAQSLEAPSAPNQIQRACAVEMHFEDFERHECTANSSELAGHARASDLSISCFSISVRTPKCVHTVWGKKHQSIVCEEHLSRRQLMLSCEAWKRIRVFGTRKSLWLPSSCSNALQPALPRIRRVLLQSTDTQALHFELKNSTVQSLQVGGFRSYLVSGAAGCASGMKRVTNKVGRLRRVMLKSPINSLDHFGQGGEFLVWFFPFSGRA